jgi:cytochrome d ubiquinol oxidase subunit II
VETIWFIFVGFLLTAYVILDGFDLGAGAIYLSAAREDRERRAILQAIGPVWDGNEVALVASGGALLLAFPLLYASSLSGFYLPMFIVLWLLVLRGVAIEMRGTIENPLWHTFWDGTFFFGSGLLPFFFGVAFANVMRGVPLGEDGYFFAPLWTDFDPLSSSPGILDWYTILIGLLALATLVAHGANFIAVKTEGALHDRCRSISTAAWIVTVLLTLISTPVTFYLLPQRFENFAGMPWGWVFPTIALGGLFGMGHFSLKGRDWPAFICSGTFIMGMIASTAFSLYPNVLPAVDPSNSLTIQNASTTAHGLTVGLIWWLIGMGLGAIYFFLTYGLFRGKVRVD